MSICPNCEKEFKQKRPDQKYCGYWYKREAAKIRAREAHVKKRYTPVEKQEAICPQCGKIFVKRNKTSVFCTRECYEKFRNKGDRAEYMKRYQKAYREKLKKERAAGIVHVVKHRVKPIMLPKVTKISERLATIKKQGFSSYAEWQKAMTLQAIKQRVV